jgi:hypothetical protein
LEWRNAKKRKGRKDMNRKLLHVENRGLKNTGIL